MKGILNLYKPQGLTSFDMVAKVRKILDLRKVGHTGTLDPKAEGVLPICVGRATKVARFITDESKEYQAELKLGVQTDTLDGEGEVTATAEVPDFTRAEIEEVVAEFRGKIEQIPPMYSALKHNGKRLYELAREGKEVEREPRQVEIYDLELLEIKLPIVKFRVSCSKGTYIRTLAADIGDQLGPGAYLTFLSRTRVGSFTVADSNTLTELATAKEEERLDDLLLPLDYVLQDLTKVRIEPKLYKLVNNGATFKLEDVAQIKGKLTYDDLVRVYSPEDEFWGIYRFKYNLETENNLFKPVRLFC
ncbi:MAG: tRNA pseudouridine(55) synthase TruB [Bacillota bacterium]